MIAISFNGQPQDIQSIEALGVALNDFDEQEQFELWVSVESGPSLCMLRDGGNAFLMYLRFSGDQGVVSLGDHTAKGTVRYMLANGQLDESPASWCIEKEQCYKAIVYVYVNEGLKPEWITWHAPE